VCHSAESIHVNVVGTSGNVFNLCVQNRAHLCAEIVSDDIDNLTVVFGSSVLTIDPGYFWTKERGEDHPHVLKDDYESSGEGWAPPLYLQQEANQDALEQDEVSDHEEQGGLTEAEPQTKRRFA
jgi:hypothetical protein